MAREEEEEEQEEEDVVARLSPFLKGPLISTRSELWVPNHHTTIITMTVNIATDAAERQGLRLPNPPPLLHTRSGNDVYDRPSTPTTNGFTSPAQTPHGSPSKNRMPPGALDLPNVFEKALKLAPSSPNKSGFNSPGFAPGKGGLNGADDSGFNESVIHQQRTGSPTRSANKENTPPGPLRTTKDLGLNPNAAAISRHEPYQQRESDTMRRQTQLRGLTAEEAEKLQLPKVKRLANVTQLCMARLVWRMDVMVLCC